MATRFELRHGSLLRALTLAAPAFEFVLFGVLISYGDVAPEGAAPLVALLILGSIAQSWLLYSAHYRITEHAIEIVHGPLRRRIALVDVLGAVPLRTLDRGAVVQLRLAYGRTAVLTPHDRTAFLGTLEARAPHLASDGAEAATRFAQ
jgi:hypothetical protein